MALRINHENVGYRYERKCPEFGFKLLLSTANVANGKGFGEPQSQTCDHSVAFLHSSTLMSPHNFLCLHYPSNQNTRKPREQSILLLLIALSFPLDFLLLRCNRFNLCLICAIGRRRNTMYSILSTIKSFRPKDLWRSRNFKYFFSFPEDMGIERQIERQMLPLLAYCAKLNAQRRRPDDVTEEQLKCSPLLAFCHGQPGR